MREDEYKRLVEEHEMAYFRGDLATSSPESYTLEEMREISAAMDASTDKVDAAMRADFESLPPEAKVKMLDMLAESGVESREWWEKILCGFFHSVHLRKFVFDLRNLLCVCLLHLIPAVLAHLLIDILLHVQIVGECTAQDGVHIRRAGFNHAVHVQIACAFGCQQKILHDALIVHSGLLQISW